MNKIILLYRNNNNLFQSIQQSDVFHLQYLHYKSPLKIKNSKDKKKRFVLIIFLYCIVFKAFLDIN